MKRKHKRWLAMLMAFILVLSPMNLAVFAEADEDETSPEMINIKSDWQGSVFGDNGGQGNITYENFEITENDDETVTLRSSNNRGKIASSTEGIAYYFKEVPSDGNFELTATAHVDAWTANSQVSFGLMLRGDILENENKSDFTGDYVAVGALDQVMKGFYKYENENVHKDGLAFNANAPAADEEYKLSIQKSGNLYILKINDEIQTIESYDGKIIYAGLFTSRNTTVTFSDVNLEVASGQVNSIHADTTDMKTEYLRGEQLDLSGLKVKAIFEDDTEAELSSSDYIVTGFDSSEVGTNTITIHYNGVTTTIDLEIKVPGVTGLDIKYYPAKSVYYKGDSFDPQGLVVVAEYENGFDYQELTSGQYSFVIAGEELSEEGYTFEEAGTVEVTVQSTETPETTTSFDVEVKDAEIAKLDIRQLPVKTLYFLGDELDLAGLSLYAEYSDKSAVRLLPGEYDVSVLDTTIVGEKEITLAYKGVTVNFQVVVKEKELSAIEVTSYPKTTYVVGETFDSTGLEVSKVYDNLDMEVLSTDDYKIDESEFDSSEAGTYEINIVPEENDIKSISFQVTVREPVEPAWKKMRFGQSSSDQRNYVDVQDDGTVKLVALEGGGKITGDHDGISFYYTEIDAEEDNFKLTADIKVIEYAKTPHDGQESFGIMARDAVNSVQDASVFASNIAAVGGFSGGTRDENGTQGFIRTGVLASDGEGSEGIQKQMLKNVRPTTDNTYPAQEYRLTLAKTNSGYTMKLNNDEEVMFYEPEILDVQDSKIYVGFYTARLATIEVSNIDFTVTAAATDAPKVEPPAEPVTPSFTIESLDKTSNTDYNLMVQSNVDGFVTIRQGQEVIAQDVEVKAGEIREVAAKLNSGNTNFSLSFLPDDTQYLTSYHQIVRNFTVQSKIFDGDIYVSPTGTSSGDGSRENPLDLDTAIHFVSEGQKIIVLEGQYVRNSKLEIKKYNDGTKDAMKYLVADPEAKDRPVIDFDRRSEGVVHSGDYWHVKGIDFARSAGNTKGYTIGGSHNIVEDVRVYEHGDTGLQISRTDGSPNKEDWPSYNLILNSVAFDNRDPSENNADGFAAKLTVGEGNVFRGCISHNNIDDGWDLYTKVGTGAIGAVTIENSIAFNNGRLTNGYEGNAGKNGFKLGGEGVHVPHVIKNSIAFGNGYFGFTSNSNPGLIAKNNIGFNNHGANLSFTTYAHIPTDFTIDGFVSYRTAEVGSAKDSYPSNVESDNNYFFTGSKSVNKSGETLSNDILDSLESIFEYDSDGNIVSIKRGGDGEILWGDVWDTFNELVNPESEAETVEAAIDFTPHVLNVKGVNNSSGNNPSVATVKIEFADETTNQEVVVESIRLNGIVKPVQDADIDGQKVTVKFSRQDLAKILEEGNQVPIVITGQLESGALFEGTTHITVRK
ncbi:bacterial Ig-like domain-containing protein [Halalkalibacter alkaliphilus]|uniref:Bacterial Ig-like domain-containing protein n=1 Tax=Halalkalibacter alkaliphilus TaxID=2917993 RepID=A0A9X2CQH0_9BACI|nr:bacterial Ig-like domain-containing protein [Halalkalibacter alkaliphilus]MCL7745751.1 bacterial Ig-like domain-containing protein [Halalkalibacter alkaliphilus]